MNDQQRRACPGCGKTIGRPLGQKDGYPIERCHACGTIFTPAVQMLAPDEHYKDYYSAANLAVPQFIATRANEIVSDLSFVRQNGRMLDIGFGSGVIMDAAKAQGWEPFGLEVSAPAIDHARQKGFEVFHGLLEEAAYPDGYFDLVTASEILEHLPDPAETLREIFRILRPGGLFWGTTPSASGISSRLMGSAWSMVTPPDHSQLFSPAAVRKMFQHAGFSDVAIKTFGFAPGEVKKYYSSRLTGRGQTRAGGNLEEAFRLNESLTRTPLRRFVKNVLNGTLNVLKMGDSLKIFARR